MAAQQHETWATLGFLRGVSTTKRSGRTFCTPQWIDLMMDVIKGASPLARSKGSRSKALVQQVSDCLSVHVCIISSLVRTWAFRGRDECLHGYEASIIFIELPV